ncbi:MAG: triacylglycerol lipase [Amphiamblys sp. WSBS2006]|nr:MAG: triacylglycerol lipase [Amphiamblys sp. WSBS2006]
MYFPFSLLKAVTAPLWGVVFYFHRLARIRKLKKEIRETKTYSEWKDAAIHGETQPRQTNHELLLLEKSLLGAWKTKTATEKILLSHAKRETLDRHIEQAHPMASHALSRLQALFLDCLKQHTRRKEGSGRRKGFLTQLYEAHGRTALSLSGGGILGKIHIGVVKSLLENNLLPDIISGTSSGAIVAAMICTVERDVLTEIIDGKHDSKMCILENSTDTSSTVSRLREKLERFFREGVLLDTAVVESRVKDLIGGCTFEEAFRKTGRILNIPVSTEHPTERGFVLNHRTAPDVFVWSAVIASCSIPKLLHPHRIVERGSDGESRFWKGEEYLFIDGSIENDIPGEFLRREFNVKHNIVSQLNPHVYFFAKNRERMQVTTVLYRKLLVYIRENRYVQKVRSLEIVRSMLVQNYFGDTTIVPDIPLDVLVQPLSTAKQNQMTDHVLRGERAAWPHLHKIKLKMKVEAEIERELGRL